MEMSQSGANYQTNLMVRFSIILTNIKVDKSRKKRGIGKSFENFVKKEQRTLEI